MSRSFLRAVSRFIFIILCFATSSVGCSASGSTPTYDDTRVAQWAADFLAGRKADVLRSVELDLVSPAPHPYASHVWAVVEDSQARLQSTWNGEMDGKLRAALGSMPQIYLLYHANKYKELLTQYPPAMAERIQDPWSLHYLADAANEMCRYDDELRYAAREAIVQPDSFQAAWTITATLLQRDRMRSAVSQLLRTNTAFAKTSAGKYVAAALQVDTGSATLARVTQWIEAHPRDARALRYRGLLLMDLGRSGEALDCFNRSTQAYPFKTFEFPNWKERASILIEMGRHADARQAVALSASLESADAALADPLAALRTAEAYAAANQLDTAVNICSDAQMRYPQYGPLPAERIALEQAVDRRDHALFNVKYEKFKEWAQQAVDLEPHNLEYRLLLASQAGDRALDILLAAGKEFVTKSENYYGQTGELLGQAGRQKEELALFKQAVVDFPQSAYMLRELSDAQLANHQPQEALDTLRQSFDYGAPNAWAIKRFKSLIMRIQGVDQIDPAIAALSRRYPAEALLRPGPTARKVNTNRQLELRLPESHSGGIACLAFSPDSAYLLTGGGEGEIKLWEIASGRLLRTFSAGMSRIRQMTLTASGKYLVAIGQSAADAGLNSIACWETETGRLVWSDESDNYRSVSAIQGTGRILIASPGGCQLWEAGSGKLIRLIDDTPCDRAFLAGTRYCLIRGLSVKVLDVGSLRPLRVFSIPYAEDVAVSPDGGLLAAAGGTYEDNFLNVYTTNSGKLLYAKHPHTQFITTLCFSPNGKLLATCSHDGSARLFDPSSGTFVATYPKLRTEYQGYSAGSPAAFSPNGRQFGVVDSDETVQLISVQDRRKATLASTSSIIAGSAHFMTGELLMVGMDEDPFVWNIRTGLGERRPALAADTISVDGSRLAKRNGNQVEIWDSHKSIKLNTFEIGQADCIVFDPTNKILACGCGDGSAKLFDVDSGKVVSTCPRVLNGVNNHIIYLEFSPDGNALLGGSLTVGVTMWDVRTGRPIRAWDGNSGTPVDLSMAAGPDHTKDPPPVRRHRARRAMQPLFGAFVSVQPKGPLAAIWVEAVIAQGSETETGKPGVHIVNVVTGEHVGDLSGDAIGVTAVAFSPDGRWLVTGGLSKKIHVWDAKSLANIATLDQNAYVESIAFSPAGDVLATCGSNGSVKIWHPARSRAGWEEVGTLVAYEDGNWVVIAPTGQFDASEQAMSRMYYVVGLEPIDLSRFKEVYYEAGLLPKLMGLSTDPLRHVGPLTSVDLSPTVQVAVDLAGNSARVTVRNRGGGIGRVEVYLNRNLIQSVAAPRKQAPTYSFTIDLTPYRRFLLPKAALHSGMANSIVARAYNGGDYLASKGTSLVVAAPSARVTPPRLFAVVAGTSHYQGSALELRFAAKDADDFATALRIAGERWLGKEAVFITELSSGSHLAATRENLIHALQAIKAAARATDIVVIYLSGHGTSLGSEYYYLTADARSFADLEVPQIRGQTAISCTTLEGLLRETAANNKLVILDTCASGRAADQLSEHRTLPSSTISSWERLKDRAGLFILAGCASDAVSYEASRFGQGLLTYSLLECMKRGEHLRQDPQDPNAQFVDASALCQYAADEVPVLAGQIGGIQKPHFRTHGDGRSFDIGRLEANDRFRIPLAGLKPVILRPTFQAEAPPIDSLGLTRAVDEALRRVTSRGAPAPIVFWDVPEYPGSYSITGRYKIDGTQVTVNAYLVRYGQAPAAASPSVAASFTVTGQTNMLSALANSILDEATRRLPPAN